MNGHVDISGDLIIDGNLSVYKYDDVKKINTTVNDYTLIVTEDISLNGEIHVSGDASFNGNLYVKNATTLSSTLAVSKAATLSSTLNVSNAATLSSTLDVHGASTMGSTVDIADTLTISKSTGTGLSVTAHTSTSSLAVTGGTTLTGALNANGGIVCDTNAFTVADTTGNTAIGGTLMVSKAATLSSTLNVNGASTMGSTVDIADTLTISKSTGTGLSVTAHTSTSSLAVTGGTTLTGALNANGGIVCDTNAFTVADTTGNTAIGGTLMVSNGATLSSTLNVLNDATFTNEITVQNITLGNGNGDISTNTVVGFQSLSNNTTGYDNVATGFQALMANTTGIRNIATGSGALRYNTTGYENSATGFQALLYNTTGYYNSAFGLKALRANTEGYRNSAFGTTALQSNTTGYYNTAIGFGTLYANITGYNNTASGYKTLYNNTGYNNTATGFSALEYNTTGFGNTANGSSALVKNTIGGYNTATGLNAGYNNTSGGYNTATGLNAGYYNTTGSYNTFLGASTNISPTNAAWTNSTAVGYQATITASNQLVLGKSDTNVYVPYRMGIGVATPSKAAVEIDGYIPHFPGVGYARFTTGSPYIHTNYQVTTQRWLSIYATDGIAGENFLAFSDRRIKNNIVDVPDNLALQQVRDIPCRYYEYIDKMNKGNVNVVGFIAQEVKEVLPSAIQLVKRYIPDEYRILEGVSWEEIADTSGNITYKMSSDLTDVSGIKYKFMVGNDLSENEIEEKIVGNADNTFTFDASYQNVFCFGKEVDDFHIIDKNQIFALHHSAIQEIDRLQLEEKEKVVVLETKNTELQSQILEEKAKVIALTAQIENIMAILQQNNIS